MLDSKEKLKPTEGKRHIKFTSSVEEAEKVQTSARGKSSKLPKYDREVQRFRKETLEQIRIFRSARKEWTHSMVDSEVGKNAVDNPTYTLQIDRRRMNTMKKLGIKTSMIRPHRKTLRPKMYFTFKKSLTVKNLAMAEEQLKARNAAIDKKTKAALMKNFRKLTKKAAARMTEENNGALEAERRETTKSVLKGNKFSRKKAAKKEDSEEINLAPEEEETIELNLDGLSSESQEEFKKLVKKLIRNPKFQWRSITDEEVDEMKAIWRVFRPGLVEKHNEEPDELKKGKSRDIRRLGKQITWFKKKTPTKKAEFKPCSCQFMEADGVIILKNVCDCSGKLQGAKTVVLGSQNIEETIKQIPNVTSDAGVPENLKFSMGKVVDSREVIRKKLMGKSPTGESNVAEESESFLIKEGDNAEKDSSLTVREKAHTFEESLSQDSIAENVKDVKYLKSNSESSSKDKLSGGGRHYKASIKKKNTKSVFVKNYKKPKVEIQHVSFKQTNHKIEEGEKAEKSSKLTETVMSLVHIFRKDQSA